MLKSSLRVYKKYILPAFLIFFTASCATSPPLLNPAPDCYRPHWNLPLDFNAVSPVIQLSFTQNTGARRVITVYEPGPWTASFYFVMSPDKAPHSITRSNHRGVFFDSGGNGVPDCFILRGGTLPNKRGKQVPYNFFALDHDGDGLVEEFIMEDLDLDGDRIMDRQSLAVLAEPDAEGHYMLGAYLQKGGMSPILKEGSSFLLKKPLWEDPFSFPDDEITRMKLFGELQKIWGEIQSK